MTETKEPTKEEFYQKLFEDVYKWACANHMTSEVAKFLAHIEVRVTNLERYELEP